MIQLVSLDCPCCGETLLVPWGVAQVGKIVEKVAVMVQIPWEVCPQCSYKLDSVRFRTPELGVKHKGVPNPQTHPGLKGLVK